MARGRIRSSHGAKATYRFPGLHQEIQNAISDDVDCVSFYESNNQHHPQNIHQTHVMGKFKCINDSCNTRGWGSKMVAILIHGFANNGYNAEVYGQRCRTCKALGLLELDEASYIERIAYRVKIWAGVRMDRPTFHQKEGPPHESSLCQGCKKGVCQQGSY